ncbi:sirohydrochlorin chelatase [Halorussus limi]|uniref:Sirohydrochlorin chelatase n=1 Tax=Halorussus limi TaxID=2938695 RepID=A0A8U0HS90_9EURY|nr:CbiX/SirB N-terminal domain-containing protein [Halorussus limi]UPV73860.1 sirohydrochlorin chelatase [Halorussus limi]
MTNESILLIGRKDPHAREVYETHANRLRNRAGVDGVRVATYETEPVRELRETFVKIESDRVYAVPLTTAHTFDTTDGVPAALSYVPGEVRYCEPVGRSPAVTDVLAERATEVVPARNDASLVLVSFGSSSKPYQRQTAEYHAARLNDQSDYDEVLTCYLLQNPTVECVRYNTSNSRTVAVPLFLTQSQATEEEIPAKLELDRGGIKYADPLGEHPRVTDAIHAEVEKQRVLATSEDGPASFEAQLAQNCRPVATDGEGVRQ